MRAVYRKELRQYFRTPLGFAFVAIFLLIAGCFFVVGNLLTASGDIRNFFSSIITVVMFLIPMLTMRSFAEERKMRTDQLLLASPIRPAQVVFGKFWAILTVFATALSGTLLYVALLAGLGQFDALVVLGNYVGLFLAAAAFTALGMFLSSLTENQMVAGVVTYCTLMGLWLIGNAGSYVNAPWLKTLIDYLSLSARFGEFAMGVFSLASVVYYVSIAALFLTATVFRIGRWRSV